MLSFQASGNRHRKRKQSIVEHMKVKVTKTYTLISLKDISTYRLKAKICHMNLVMHSLNIKKF